MIKIITDLKLLRKKSEFVDFKDGKEILEKLKIKMKEVGNKGMGLCGPQIGFYKRVIYINYRNQVKLSIINPIILKVSDQDSVMEEGCLSILKTIKKPIKVPRPKKIKLKYTDEFNNINIMKFDGIIGRAIQHEIDHLEGILIIDYKDNQ
jgi:peptide deformylase